VVLSPLVCTSWVHQHDSPDGRQSGKSFCRLLALWLFAVTTNGLSVSHACFIETEPAIAHCKSYACPACTLCVSHCSAYQAQLVCKLRVFELEQPVTHGV